MNIIKANNADKLTITIEGRVDTTTSPELESAIQASIDGVKELVLDFAKVEYISSAGLRVLLSTQKKMSSQGSMVVTNVSEEIMEILEVTGFVDILTIQ